MSEQDIPLFDFIETAAFVAQLERMLRWRPCMPFKQIC